MRLKHVNVRVLLPSLLAVLALSAVVASAAQASAEGPFFKDGSSRLGAGQSQEFTAGRGHYVMSAGSIVVSCTGMSAATGSKILGSATGKPGTIETTFTYTGCTVSGNGPGCEVKGGSLKTEPLVGTLVYNESKTYVDVLFKPAKKHIFVNLEFGSKSGSCSRTPIPVSGELVTKVTEGKETEEWVQVGKEPAEAHAVGLLVAQPQYVYEEGAGLVEVEALEAGGGFGIQGSSQLELTNNALWGVFT
jgi:hypothetical protein